MATMERRVCGDWACEIGGSVEEERRDGEAVRTDTENEMQKE